MKLGHEFYPLKSLKNNQKYGVFLKKIFEFRVNSRELESPIQTAMYPPFTKGTGSCCTNFYAPPPPPAQGLLSWPWALLALVFLFACCRALSLDPSALEPSPTRRCCCSYYCYLQCPSCYFRLHFQW